MSIVVTVEDLQDVSKMTGTELEKYVNKDIEEFQTWFCKNVDKEAVALTGPEIAILKSYLWYKTHSGKTPHG